MDVRQIGPATMSGRISALDALESDPRILYVGAAGGGVWKTTNAGTTFKPIFEDYPQSIGAIRIDQQNPKTVWVGTGEKWTRNSVSVGAGIYKTTNGGDRWKLMGLEKTERIADIEIHPENPNVVWAAALGHLWGPNVERGVYKTNDGGKTWQQVLFVDENTGCAELIVDPKNPDILYAAMWDFRRQPHTFRSGGPGSALYKSTDGGNTWTLFEADGLPTGTLGRIAMAFSPAMPERVYALIESKNTALFRSDDDGKSWEEVNNSGPIARRPFYFFQLYPDPVDSARVYKPGYQLLVSDDGGEKFSSAYTATTGAIHPDHHAFFVSKKDPNFLYVGTDGGVFRSLDRGASWEMLRNLPVSTFYHVSVDNETPYNVYGGLQDNGSWTGPSQSAGSIAPADWKNLGGGDGFYVFPDAQDPNIVYWQSQGGNIIRFLKDTRESKSIRPFAPAADKLRFNWDTPVHFSKDGNRMYVGAQYLFRSTNRGDTWERISPDLTTNDPQKQKQEESGGLTIDNSTAENHCTIITIGESPMNDQVIWVGTDDGNLYLTQDGGKNWTMLNGKLPNIPANTWVSYVEPSQHMPGTAYVTFDGHRMDDMQGYVLKTTDFGETWTTSPAEEIAGYCHVIKEDPVNPNLLFLGTEMGLYVSIDGAQHWVPFKGNVPPVSIRDMVIQTQSHDLVMATHGRGIFILDDITALRGLTAKLVTQDFAFLPSRTSYIRPPQFEPGYRGDNEYQGPNPTSNAYFTYYLKKRHIFGKMTIEVLDATGNVLAELPSGKRKGINRVEWISRRPSPKLPTSNILARGAIFGPSYPPGTYTIRVTKGDEVYEGKLELALYPSSPHSVADREAQEQAVEQGYQALEQLTVLAEQVKAAQEQAEGLAEKTSGGLKRQVAQFAQELTQLLDALVAHSEGGGISGKERLREHLSNVFGDISRYEGKPTDSQLARLRIYARDLDRYQQQFDDLVKGKMAKVNKGLVRKSLSPITLPTPEEILEEDK